MKLVQKNLKESAYLQLYKIILEMIENGELLEGDSLLPEREICKIQNVSRITVSSAVSKLVNEGYLKRHVGKGTFVTKKKNNKTRYQKLQGLTEISKEKGAILKNKLISFEIVNLDKHLATKLNTQSARIYKITRLRMIDGEPALLEYIYIDPVMCPELYKISIDDDSWYNSLQEKYNHKLQRAEQTIKPIALSEEQALIFSKTPKTLALQVERVVYTNEEKIFDYTISIFMKHDFDVIL